MTRLDSVSAWIGRYRAAWESNDPDDIAGLFTATAEYFTEPFATPWRGRDEIVAGWLAHRDEPGETTFEWHPVAITDYVAIIQGTTVYPDKKFSNMWVIRLDDTGDCQEFTEWWMQQPTPAPASGQ
jgi:hypothetical protein